jgi:hypothetical protein
LFENRVSEKDEAMNKPVFASSLSWTHVIVLTFVGWNIAIAPITWAATNVVNTETKLVPNSGARDLQFGLDVAINDNAAAVGAQSSFNGSVYIYTLSGTNWTQTQILTAGTPQGQLDQFGFAVALSSDRLVVGQPAARPQPRQVFVYTNSGTLWGLQQTLTRDVPIEGSVFGSAVDVSANTIAVGDALDYSGSGALFEGGVFVYTEVAGTWVLQATLRANDPSTNLHLGSSVAIDGDTILAGASDAVYVFVRSGTNWTQQQKLIDPVLASGSGFGGSVALEGDLAVVAARKAASDSDSGAIHIFRRTGTTWVLEQSITLGDNEFNSLFGSTVAIHNGLISVGVPNAIVDGALQAGAVRIYRFAGSRRKRRSSWCFSWGFH